MDGLIKGVTLTYKLSNIHFHTGSEHTVNKHRYPVEMHMVHSLDDKFKSLTKYEKLVIGVFFTNEDADGYENPLLAAFNLNTLKVNLHETLAYSQDAAIPEQIHAVPTTVVLSLPRLLDDSALH